MSVNNEAGDHHQHREDYEFYSPAESKEKTGKGFLVRYDPTIENQNPIMKLKSHI